MSDKNKISFQNILIPIDGSHPSLHAEELAVLLAKAFESKVTVLHTIPRELIQSVSHSVTNLPPSIANELRASLEQKGAHVIANANALYREENIPVETKLIEYGDPAESILEACGEYDLIIMGGRGEGDTGEFDLGSVAKKIVRHSQCPVLLVKKRSPISKILVPINGSDYAKKALNYAVELAEKQHAKLTLLNVARGAPPILEQDTAKRIGQSFLAEARKFVEASGINPTTQIEYGSPATVITDVAEKGDYDLIVMGSKGHSGIRRFLLGGVSDKVSQTAKSSVLIVK